MSDHLRSPGLAWENKQLIEERDALKAQVSVLVRTEELDKKVINELRAERDRLRVVLDEKRDPGSTRLAELGNYHAQRRLAAEHIDKVCDYNIAECNRLQAQVEELENVLKDAATVTRRESDLLQRTVEPLVARVAELEDELRKWRDACVEDPYYEDPSICSPATVDGFRKRISELEASQCTHGRNLGIWHNYPRQVTAGVKMLADLLSEARNTLAWDLETITYEQRDDLVSRIETALNEVKS